MEYHADRFTDASVMIYAKGKLVGLLLANSREDAIHSHQGLSYGGFIVKPIIKTLDMLAMVNATLKFYAERGKRQLQIKTLPSIYRSKPTEAEALALAMLKGTITRTDSYYIIDLAEGYQPNRNRKRALKKAEASGLKLVSGCFEPFWNKVLIPNLTERFGVKPVHSLAEIELLAKRFPKQIHCYGAFLNDEIKAGVVIFETKHVAHFQYSSGTDSRNEDGALDVLFDAIIKKYLRKKYISFGSSSEGNGTILNEGLVYWKESFGAVPLTQHFYSILLSNLSS
ncbi:GNAT family N-acetyltransferase [Gangjinia marincola]